MLPETMTVEQLEEVIDSHDCKLSPDSGCICEFYKQVLSRKVAKLPTVDWLLRHDRKNYV